MWTAKKKHSEQQIKPKVDSKKKNQGGQQKKKTVGRKNKHRWAAIKTKR